MNKFHIYLFILLFPSLVIGQTLTDKVQENGMLFYRSMDSAYVQLNQLIKEAQQQNNKTVELLLLDRKCHYFYNKTSIDSLFTTSQVLQQKAIAYKNKSYEASSYLYLAESYSLNELPEKALQELTKAEKTLEQSKRDIPRNFFIKSNILISQSNIYYDNKDYQKAILKHRELINTGEDIENKERRDHFQYVNYSNIANIYLNTNIDSAYYFAKKSLDLEHKINGESNITGANYFIIGKVAEKRKDTINALKNYRTSYNILQESGDALNKMQLFQSLYDIYSLQQQQDSAAIFKKKLDEYNVQMLEKKYNSLKEIVNQEPKVVKKKYPTTLLISVGLLSISLIILGFYYFKRQRMPKSEVETSKSQQELLAENFETLLALLKKDDPGFLALFENIYPNFRNKLLSIEPKLTISEIQFCALLKMNLSTKKIAQLTYIETRTVQNKKHRIRKKLHIPKDIDTYNWFNNL